MSNTKGIRSRKGKKGIHMNTEAEKAKRPLLFRILIPIEVCLVVLLVLSFLFIALSSILDRAAGFLLVYEIHGTSMYPTMQEGYMTAVKKGGFEDIEVGDIIMFYDVDGPSMHSSSTTSHLTKVDLPDDWMPGDPVPHTTSSDSSVADSTPASEEPEDADYLSYDAYGSDVSKDQLQIDTSRTTTHRIVQVGVDINGQKLVYTEGDGNGYKDQYATMEDRIT